MRKPATTVRTYRLKSMVIVRTLAEVLVLFTLLILPLALLLNGKFADLPASARIVLAVAAVGSVCLLPWFGFITFQVTVDGTGLRTIALFLRQQCQWNQIKKLSRRSSHGWLRYVVELDDNTEITFPVMLADCDDLVAGIRGRLPAGGAGGAGDPFRVFKNDPVALVFQLLGAVGGIIFICIFWLFSASMFKTGSESDFVAVIIFSVVCSGILAWRTVVVALMPRVVQLAPDQLSLRTLFFERKYRWDDVLGIKQSFPLLPEGFVLKTRRGSYLIGCGMDAADELEDAVRRRIDARRQPQVPRAKRRNR